MAIEAILVTVVAAYIGTRRKSSMEKTVIIMLGVMVVMVVSVGLMDLMGIDGVVLVGIVVLAGMAVTEGKKGGGVTVRVGVFEVRGT